MQPNSKKQKIEFYSKQKLNLARVSKQFLVLKWSQDGFSMIIPGLRPKEGRLHLGDPPQSEAWLHQQLPGAEGSNFIIKWNFDL